nr:MAG TPA: hypothetical protein [Caudoviricetes sp.]
MQPSDIEIQDYNMKKIFSILNENNLCNAE